MQFTNYHFYRRELQILKVDMNLLSICLTKDSSTDLKPNADKFPMIRCCYFENISTVKMARFLNKMYPLYNVSRVVGNYDEFLQCALITTSFQGILNRRLNRKNRCPQIMVLVFLFIYFLCG